MKRVLALVGCGSKKHNQATEAKSLYTSTYFSKKRQWAEGCHDWRILSAKHGVVHPNTVLEPYDISMNDLSETDIEEWSNEVVEDLTTILSDFEEVVILAGSDYFSPIDQNLKQAPPTVRWPFRGKRLFEQMEWLQQNSPPDQSRIESFE